MVKQIRQIYIAFLLVALWAPHQITFGQNTETVNVRAADHPTSSRLVFDWQENVEYTARLENNMLQISFGNDAVPQWGKLERQQLRFLANPQYETGENSLTITLDLKADVRLAHFRSGSKIIIDIIDISAPSTSIHDKAETGQASVGPEVRPTQRPETLALEPAPAESVGPKPSSNDDSLKIRVSRTSDNLQMAYPWQQEVFAAAFIRFDMLWVVFETKTIVDHTRLNQYLGDRILSVNQIDSPDKTILMYELKAGQNLEVHKADSTWVVNLSATHTDATLPIAVGQQTSGKNEERIFFPAVNLGSITTIDDPLIGDQIAVVPLLTSSQGVHKERIYTEFVALETAQGIAVQLVADDLQIRRLRKGVLVSRQSGLALSKSRLSSKLSRSGERGDDEDNPEKLIDLPLWKKGPLEGEDYITNRHELLYQLSIVSSDERNEARWNLARFYLGNGAAADALGVLDIMKSHEPDLVESSDFRAVYGVTNIFLRRYGQGVKYLTHKTLVAEPISLLWRAIANQGFGHNKEALEDFHRGADFMVVHEPKDRARILLAAIRAAHGVEDYAFMKSQLSILKLYPMNADNLTEVEYWEAMMTQKDGNVLQAESELTAVIKKKSRRTMAWAMLELVNSQHSTGKIDATEAIDQLEKLRFAWRGDDFELDLLARLGELYFELQEYDTGLEILKQAATYFTKSRKTRELTNIMSKVYRDLFLNKKADDLSPIKSVALYMKFAELTPLGTEGDLMARRLANRLVSLDLLRQAEDILNHQIKHRLKGIPQAVVASRLAVIYILDAKPDEAMKILRATRQAQIPEDVEDGRIKIEARALIELGSYEEAEVLIEDKSGADVDELRSDIYWKGEDWIKFIRHSEILLARSDQKDGLSTPDRQTILRLAVAFSLNEDKGGISALRDRYLTPMSNGLYAETFDVITAKHIRSGQDVRQLTKSIASVGKLETFMDSYRAQFLTAEN